MNLNDKHVVVTGAASGIGRAMASRFAREGARRVVVSDLDEAGISTVVEEIERDFPGVAVAAVCDVGAAKPIVELIDTAEQDGGPIDLFCANAGIGGGTGLLETTDEQWDAAFDVNIRSHVVAARRLIPGWVERGEGYFLSTASAAGLLNVIGSAPYALTKHAAVAFAEWLAITYREDGVRVSCLCPMGVQTRLLEDGLEQPGDVGVGMRVVASAGRVLAPDEVAEAVVAGLAEERFLILPHPEVHAMLQGKVADHDGWLAAMRHVRSSAAAATG
jgi:NAD(P)-dependent dehydrogenase (short-subunit alcohol dehydrogenase family)